MAFSSIRIVTDDVDRLVAFYEQLIGSAAQRLTPDFAQFTSARDGAGDGDGDGDGAGSGPILAIASTATVAMLDGAMLPAANRSVFVEFEVADVDDAFARLSVDQGAVVLAPTTMPWGNRSALVRDPDGTVVNLFSRPAR